VGDAAVAAASSVHGFVPALTSFVGRESAVGRVAGLLGEYRMVTVTGPGGVGKTRLAGEVARRVAGRFADGVWGVELATVGEPALVPAAVAVAVAVRQPPGLSIVEALAGVLARRQLLLVLDNCEHVAAAVAELCGALLTAAVTAMRILATVSGGRDWAAGLACMQTAGSLRQGSPPSMDGLGPVRPCELTSCVA